MANAVSLSEAKVLIPDQANVEALRDMISRSVPVNRSRDPEMALIASGAMQGLIHKSVMETMPRGDCEIVDVVFFKVSPGFRKKLNCVDLETEYEKRSLISADPYSLLAVHEAYPAFANDYPSGTQWKNEHGEYCVMEYGITVNSHAVVRVCKSDQDWHPDWWFAGIRK